MATVKLCGVPYQSREPAVDMLQKMAKVNEKRDAFEKMVLTAYRVLKIVAVALTTFAVLIGAPLLEILCMGLVTMGCFKLHGHMQEIFKARMEVNRSLLAQLHNRVQQLPLQAQALPPAPPAPAPAAPAPVEAARVGEQPAAPVAAEQPAAPEVGEELAQPVGPEEV